MEADLVRVGRALAVPSRAAMIALLFDGQAHTAGALAVAAGVSSPTASEHLTVLVESGLVAVTSEGRFRRFHLVSAEVATALEAFGPPRPRDAVSSLRLSREQKRVRAARTCYDHLAGLLGVAVLDMLMAKRWLTSGLDAVTAAGELGLAAIGVDVDALDRTRRPLMRSCVDWTERRPHLAGGLGAAIASTALASGWVSRVPDSRGLLVTATGRHELDRLGVNL